MAGRLGIKARFSLRVNPDVDAVTHPYISTGLRDHKFGIDIDDAARVYAHSKTLPNLEATGVDCHIGSQILDYSSIIEAARNVLPGMIDSLIADGHHISHVDFGGGLGISYREGGRSVVIVTSSRLCSKELKATRSKFWSSPAVPSLARRASC